MLSPIKKAEPKQIFEKVTILQEITEEQQNNSYVSLNRKCDFCGSVQMLPSGSCFVCQVCGTSMGCG